MKTRLISFSLCFIMCMTVFCGCVSFPDEAIATVRLATDAEIADKDGFVYCFDEYTLNGTHNIIISFDKDITDFKFWIIDDSEGLYFKDCIYSLDKVGANEKIFISTYINDATINRGFSFKYNAGREFLKIEYAMSGESENALSAVGGLDYRVNEEE